MPPTGNADGAKSALHFAQMTRSPSNPHRPHFLGNRSSRVASEQKLNKLLALVVKVFIAFNFVSLTVYALDSELSRPNFI